MLATGAFRGVRRESPGHPFLGLTIFIFLGAMRMSMSEGIENLGRGLFVDFCNVFIAQVLRQI